MNRRGRPSGQSWWTFCANHMPEIAAMDLFVVPTLASGLLYGLSSCGSTVRARLDQRDEQPDGGLIARQITKRSRQSAPGYVIRDRDRVFGFSRYPADARNGHSGQANRDAVALAERFC